MENYVIPTIYNLELMLRAKGKRAYCLAHFYLQYPHYREWFKFLKKIGYFITLDNSAAEHSLVTEEKLLKIVDELQPDEVIPPDVLFNKEKTLNNFFNFISKNTDTNIFACPQGSNKDEWLECYDVMAAHPRTTVIGLSKITVPVCFEVCKQGEYDRKIKEGRHKCVDFLYSSGRLTTPLHFLGMGDPTEYKYYTQNTKFKNVRDMFRTTDSCYAVLAGVSGVNFEKYHKNFLPIPRIKTYNEFYEIDITDNDLYKLCLDNIEFLRGELDG